jgi:hypothetical protein
MSHNDAGLGIQFDVTYLNKRNATITWDRLCKDINNLEATQRRDRRTLEEAVRRNDTGPPLSDAEKRKHERVSSGDYRFDQHERLRDAYARREDFLFYQNDLNRLDRINALKEEEDRRETFNDDRPKLLQFVAGDNPFLQELLTFYDTHNVGSADYRLGRTDVLGNAIGVPTMRAVGPHELHLWTPPYRRDLAGLRGAASAADITPWALNLDLAEIERRRAEIEDQPVIPRDQGQTLSYGTHTERRRAERAAFRSESITHRDRPSTSNLRNEREERFESMQTDSGLFIAAKESSFDWLTSYDCLGRVSSGYIARIPPAVPLAADDMIRPDTPDQGDKDDNDIQDNTKPSAEPEANSSDALRTIQDAQEPKGDLPSERAGTVGQENEVAPARRILRSATRKDAALAAEVELAQPPKPVVEEEPILDYDYYYEKAEFTRPAKILRTYDRELTTSWFEATDGRRELHMGHLKPDSSPVLSPPRFLMQSDAAATSIPNGIPDISLGPVKYPRCNLDRDCRAWWDHDSAENCWKAFEIKRLEENEDEDPIRPVDDQFINRDRGELHIPVAASGRKVYRSRLRDHYGRLANEKRQWPRFGIRVPYGPMTLLENPRFGQDDGDGSVIPSMAVPLVSVPQEPWNTEPDTIYPNGGEESADSSSEDDDSESEAESETNGDLFAASYRESSGGPSMVQGS